MTAQAARNHWIARLIVAGGMLAALGMLAISAVQSHNAAHANRRAIRAIQNDRRIRLAQINGVALRLCQYSQDNRELQRSSIREQPAIVRSRFNAIGATPVQVAHVVRLAETRRDRLLARYKPVTCPTAFVAGQ